MKSATDFLKTGIALHSIGLSVSPSDFWVSFSSSRYGPVDAQCIGLALNDELQRL
jgi:hypothetical protein